jgi:hypothetical protein
VLGELALILRFSYDAGQGFGLEDGRGERELRGGVVTLAEGGLHPDQTDLERLDGRAGELLVQVGLRPQQVERGPAAGDPGTRAAAWWCSPPLVGWRLVGRLLESWGPGAPGGGNTACRVGPDESCGIPHPAP